MTNASQNNKNTDVHELIKRYNKVYRRACRKNVTIKKLIYSVAYFTLELGMLTAMLIFAGGLLAKIITSCISPADGIINGMRLLGIPVWCGALIYSLADTARTHWNNDNIFNSREIKKFIEDVNSGLVNPITAENGTYFFRIKRHLTANYGTDAKMIGSWTLCMVHENACVITSIYGDNGPTIVTDPTINVQMRTAEDLNRWKETVVPEATQVHCVKIKIFPQLPWISPCATSGSEAAYNQNTILMTDESADDIIQKLKPIMTAVINEAIINKLEESVRTGEPITKIECRSKTGGTKGDPQKQRLYTPVTQNDLAVYFKRENSQRSSTLSTEMDELNTEIQEYLSERHILDIAIYNNKNLFSAEEIEDAIKRAENGEIELVKTRSIQQKFIPRKRLSEKDMTGIWELGWEVYTSIAERERHKFKIMTSVYGTKGPTFKDELTSVVHFADKADMERWSELPTPDDIYIPCVEVKMFPNILGQKWKYLLPIQNMENVDKIQQAFKSICSEIVSHILSEKLKELKEQNKFIEKDDEDVFSIIKEEDLVPFFRKDGAMNGCDIARRIEALNEAVEKYSMNRQPILGSVQGIGQDE